MIKIFDKLVSYLNSNLKKMDDTDLILEIPSYLVFVTHNAAKHNLPDLIAKKEQYDGVLKKSSLEPIRDIFAEIQKHLIRLVNKIINNTDAQEKTLLLGSLPGYHKVYLDPVANKFSIEFEPFQKLYYTSSLDPNNEKELATLALFDLLIDNDISPDQIGKCIGCGNYFFRETRHRRSYCSPSCGHLTRTRERYQKKD
jgi:hypothetical protein